MLASSGSFSPQLQAGSFRSRVGWLSACHKSLPRFEAWHHSDLSIEWVPFVLIPPSHRRGSATTVFGLNRHHRSDTASSFSWFSTTRHSCVFPRVAAEPRRCHCEHGDLIELQLRFDGGATAIIGGMTAVLAPALRGQWGGSTVVAPW